jgi:hypothetical protein
MMMLCVPLLLCADQTATEMQANSMCHLRCCRLILVVLSLSLLPADPDEDPAGIGSVTNYRRGLSPCVFVPWENVATSVLNLPIQEMDYYMPG